MSPTILQSKIHRLTLEHHFIPERRKKKLKSVAQAISQELESQDLCRVMAICTHNSRRSQLMEAWIVAAAQYYNVEGISASSGGTEATEFNIRMVVAMRTTGFHLTERSSGHNPSYELTPLTPTLLGHRMFSKRYDDSYNPQHGFIAIMVCDHADQNCPVVLGAKQRFSIPYDDPKIDDDTPMEHDAYMQTIDKIGREVIYIFGQIAASTYRDK